MIKFLQLLSKILEIFVKGPTPLAFTASDFFSYNPKQVDPDPDILEIRQPILFKMI